MAKIPGQIQYTESVPTAAVGAVRAPMNVNFGREAIARGLENLGAAFEKVQDANDIMELSTAQRKSEEIHNASILGLQGIDPSDNDGIQKLKETRDADLNKLITSEKSGAVQKALKRHFDSEQPRWELHFQGEVLQKKARYAKDQGDLLGQQYLADGQTDKYLVLLHNELATDIISKPHFDYLVKNADFNTKLGQANKAIYENNPEAAQEFLKAENFQGADNEILKKRSEMLSLGQEQLNHLGVQFDNNINEQMNKIDQNKDLSATELQNSAADLDRQIDESNIGGKKKMQMHKEIRSWVKDEGNMDFERIRSLEDRIERVKAYGVTDPELIPDINRARLEGALGSRKEGSGKEANRMIRAATSAKINVSITATRSVQSDFASTVKRFPNGLELEHLLHKDILDALDEHPEWNDTEAMSFASSRAKVYENIAEQQSGALIEMRKRGQKYLGWQDLPKETQKKDLESLRNVKVPTFQWGTTPLSGDWTKADVQKAQEIIGGSKTITPDMTKKFADYLTEQSKAHFEKIGLPKVTNKEQRDKLPSGSQYIDRNGNIATKQ